MIRSEIAEGIARASAAAAIAILVTGCTVFTLIWSVTTQTPWALPGEWWVLQGGIVAWVFKDNIMRLPPANPPTP